VFCRDSDGVVTHLVESIEKAPFLKRSVEAFFDEGLEVMDAAYLLGNVSDLRSVGIGRNAVSTAAVYFGRELLTQQCTRMFDLLKKM
jgi:hypothetical protein